ncbi:MAG TPA: glycosyltransferase [Vicinamibacterales bacterium]|nr:glycosyltransferase [Vicinamibacterales bacterium]
MRVLHVSSGNMYGGVETLLTTLAREAHVAPGMEPRFALCFEGRISAELKALDCAPHLLGPASLSRPRTVLRARREMRSLLQREPCDVVVCHQPWTCVLFASAIRAAGLPVVLWVHMASRGRHWLERLCRLTSPDAAICNSKFTAGLVRGWLPHAQVEHCYLPLSRPQASESGAHRQAIRNAFGTAERDVVLVQVSRLESFKGHSVLLAALGRLRGLAGWTCWIVGGVQRPEEADYLRALKQLAVEQGISERVRFVGERDDVIQILRAANIYCQPNTKPEGFGLTFVEAMHAGLPVVTSGIGGASEIVDQSCGMLTPPGDVPALSSALNRLIVDRALNTRLGDEAQRRSESLCNVPRQMGRIHAVLASLAATRTAATHDWETQRD